MNFKSFRLLPNREDLLTDDIMAFIIAEEQIAAKVMSRESQAILEIQND